MSSSWLKGVVGAATVMTAGIAAAENYQALIYSPPPGAAGMWVNGAGDNALMGGYAFVGTEVHAYYRTNTGSKSMHIPGWQSTEITDSWGSTYHCGVGHASFGGAYRALFWVGGGAAVQLHPTGEQYLDSGCEGGGGQQQVGWVGGPLTCTPCGGAGTQHAAMWSRTAASFSRLHAPGHRDTHAFDTDGIRQVGDGAPLMSSTVHALLWNGPNSFAVNLHPSGFAGSKAMGVWGTQQGGVAFTGDFKSRACIWSGTAASFVNLHPGIFENTQVNAVRNGLQVGEGNPLSTPFRTQAIAWHGSAATWINLHARLPYPFNLWNSYTTGIDNLGNVVGYIHNEGTLDYRPVVWKRI